MAKGVCTLYRKQGILETCLLREVGMSALKLTGENILKGVDNILKLHYIISPSSSREKDKLSGKIQGAWQSLKSGVEWSGEITF